MKTESARSSAPESIQPKRLAFFERYLIVWVLVCMGVGLAFGKLLVPSVVEEPAGPEKLRQHFNVNPIHQA